MYLVLTQIMIHGIGKADCQNLSNKISLRCRSSFAITTIIYVALRCVDAGGPVSDLQMKTRDYAEKIGEQHREGYSLMV